MFTTLCPMGSRCVMPIGQGQLPCVSLFFTYFCYYPRDLDIRQNLSCNTTKSCTVYSQWINKDHVEVPINIAIHPESKLLGLLKSVHQIIIMKSMIINHKSLREGW